LTFISILFVLANIIQQQKQYDNDKRLKRITEDEDLFSRLLLVNNLLEQLSSHILGTGIELKGFYDKELAEPLNSHTMRFYTNRNFYRLLEQDYLLIYKAFLRNISEDKEKYFNRLFSSIDFYSESIPDLIRIYMDYQIRKTESIKGIVDQIELAMDNCATVLGKLKDIDPKNYTNNIWYKTINSSIVEYHDFIEIEENEETNLLELSNNFLKPFLKKLLEIKEAKPSELIEDIIMNISRARKRIYKVKKDGEELYSNMKSSYDLYYTEESDYFKALLALKDRISEDTKRKPVGNNM
jgi:hypothetical protein